MNIKIEPGVQWNDWKTNPPPKRHWIAARYSHMDIDKCVVVKTCRRGCCVLDGGSGLVLRLPPEWIEVPEALRSLVEHYQAILDGPDSKANPVDFMT